MVPSSPQAWEPDRPSPAKHNSSSPKISLPRSVSQGEGCLPRATQGSPRLVTALRLNGLHWRRDPMQQVSITFRRSSATANPGQSSRTLSIGCLCGSRCVTDLGRREPWCLGTISPGMVVCGGWAFPNRVATDGHRVPRAPASASVSSLVDHAAPRSGPLAH